MIQVCTARLVALLEWMLCTAYALLDHAPLPGLVRRYVRDALSLMLKLLPGSASQCKSKQAASEPSQLHISWPGFGILFFWQLGILKYLTHNFELSQLQLVGSSAGGLLCVLAACDVDPHAAVRRAHDLCVRTGMFERPWGLAGVWGGLVRTWLEELLPSDAAERCSGRVTVVVTELPWLRTRSISCFASREDLIEVALASSHVPLFLDGRFAARCRGRWCIDGSFCYILFRRTMGLIPTGAKVLLFDPWSDKGLRSSWSWSQCLELLGLPGATWLLDCGHAHAQALHEAGALNELPVIVAVPAHAGGCCGNGHGEEGDAVGMLGKVPGGVLDTDAVVVIGQAASADGNAEGKAPPDAAALACGEQARGVCIGADQAVQAVAAAVSAGASAVLEGRAGPSYCREPC